MTLADCSVREVVHIPGFGGADVVDPRRGRVRIVRVCERSFRAGAGLRCVGIGIVTTLGPATEVCRGSEVTR